MQNKDYSLSLLKSIKILLNEFRKLIFQNSDIIDQIIDSRNVIYLSYKKNENFFFKVTNPNLTSDRRSFFNFNYFPQDEHFLNKTSFNNEFSIILEHFSTWITLLREYDEIHLDEDDILEKFYEDEVYHEIEILDNDAYTTPFDHQKQLILYNFLQNIEIELKKQPLIDKEIKTIIEETENVKSNIQNFTKNVALRKVAKILAKIKKKGLQLFVDIVKDTAKEIIIKALRGDVNELGKYIHHHF